MTKLDWEKAKRQQGRRRPSRWNTKTRLDRQIAMAEFAAKYNLTCFKCGLTGEWAKTGMSKRGPWAICSSCVQIPAKR